MFYNKNKFILIVLRFEYSFYSIICNAYVKYERNLRK